MVEACSCQPPRSRKVTYIGFATSRERFADLLDCSVGAKLGLVKCCKSAAPDVDDRAGFLVLSIPMVSAIEGTDRGGANMVHLRTSLLVVRRHL